MSPGICWVVACLSLVFIATTSRGIEISRVSVSVESFSPPRGQGVTIKYAIDVPGITNIDIFDPDFCLVRRLLKDIHQEKGAHEIEWDGKDLDGNLVPDEAYFFTIVAEDRDRNQAVYDPTTLSGGEEFDITTANVDAASNTITYRLAKPSRMLIRVGISGGPLLNVPVSWEPRISGEITEYWKGRDQDGFIDLLAHPRFKMVITGFYLVENSVITYGNTEEDYYNYKLRLGNQGQKKPARTSAPREKGTKISPHYLRPRVLDKPVDVALTFPQNSSGDSAVVPISPERELVRVELAETDKVNFIDEPFEISFFLDGEYYSEEEVGYTPYNWLWSLDNVDEGEHILTVNVSSFKDIIGIRSRKIRVIK